MKLTTCTHNVRAMKLACVAIAACALVGASSAHAALIGHWTFDEGTGTTAADSSTNANTATLAGAAGSWTTGQIDDAYELGGNTSRFELADSSDLQVTGAVSVSAWVRPSAISNFGVIAGIDQTGGTANDMYSLKTTGSSSNRLNWQVIGPGTNVNLESSDNFFGTGELSDGSQWVHVVGVYDPSGGGSAVLYINGLPDVSTASVPTSIQSVATPFQIGQNAADSGFPYLGAVDDIRVYDEALSAQDVAALFAAAQPVPTPAALPAGLALLTLAAARRRRMK